MNELLSGSYDAHRLLLVLAAVGYFAYRTRPHFWMPRYAHALAGGAVLVGLCLLLMTPADAPVHQRAARLAEEGRDGRDLPGAGLLLLHRLRRPAGGVRSGARVSAVRRRSRGRRLLRGGLIAEGGELKVDNNRPAACAEPISASVAPGTSAAISSSSAAPGGTDTSCRRNRTASATAAATHSAGMLSAVGHSGSVRA